MKDVLLLLNGEVSTILCSKSKFAKGFCQLSFCALHDRVSSLAAHPLSDPDMFWLRESLLNYTMLSVDHNQLPPSSTEQDFLEDVYGFVKKRKLITKSQAAT